jgi:mono/diheme cytochrome c family protein
MAVGAVFFVVLMVFAYDVIKIDWISFMEIQPSFKPMENPLPIPEGSMPFEGAAFVPGMGAPQNLVPSDQVSITRGSQLYAINCAQCHGITGQGDGVVAAFLQERTPVNLTREAVQSKSDGALFMTISNGVINAMPALNENLTVRERWDVVNYMRTLSP